MAIEFNCPFCTSAIRVPDGAAGKKGTCPRCETPILVPAVEIPPPDEANQEQPIRQPEQEAVPPPPVPSVPPTGAADFAEAGEPVFPGPPTSEGGEFPVFDPAAAAPSSQPAPSYARALKRRRKRGGLGVLVPVLCGVGLLGVAAWFVAQSGPDLEGELTAEALPDFRNAVGAVGKEDLGDVPEAAVQFVLAGLQEAPLRLTSKLMETEFRGTRGGIEVRVYEGSETTFFRVAPRDNEDFNDWVAERAAALEKPRQKQLQAAIRKFFGEYNETEGNIPDAAGYRNALGLSAAVSRVGYHLSAVADGRLFRCVYEDADHRLYFLLPKNTRKFIVEGRKIGDGKPLFPGRYKVTVE